MFRVTLYLMVFQGARDVGVAVFHSLRQITVRLKLWVKVEFIWMEIVVIDNSESNKTAILFTYTLLATMDRSVLILLILSGFLVGLIILLKNYRNTKQKLWEIN